MRERSRGGASRGAMHVPPTAAWGSRKSPEKKSVSGQWDSGSPLDSAKHGLMPQRITRQEGPGNRNKSIYRKWRPDFSCLPKFVSTDLYPTPRLRSNQCYLKNWWLEPPRFGGEFVWAGKKIEYFVWKGKNLRKCMTNGKREKCMSLMIISFKNSCVYVKAK